MMMMVVLPQTIPESLCIFELKVSCMVEDLFISYVSSFRGAWSCIMPFHVATNLQPASFNKGGKAGRTGGPVCRIAAIMQDSRLHTLRDNRICRQGRTNLQSLRLKSSRLNCPQILPRHNRREFLFSALEKLAKVSLWKIVRHRSFPSSHGFLS